MKAYRVEDMNGRLGIWRDFDGNVSPVFEKLTDGKARNLPMPDDDFYRRGGSRWFASTDTAEKLKAWFSATDIEQLCALGYKVVEFVVSELVFKSEFESVFRREDVLSWREVSPADIWPELAA